MYYVVEIFGVRSKTVNQTEYIDVARHTAYNHSARTGLVVEIQNELGRAIERVQAWSERDL